MISATTLLFVCVWLAPAAATETTPEAAPAPLEADGSGWKCKPEDNICGLSKPGQLSDPAAVKHGELMDATPEIQRMKREGIDPDSPEGIALRNKATDRVKRACEEVMNEEGHCSVWKEIEHEDGREIPDLTAKVKPKVDVDDDAR